MRVAVTGTPGTGKTTAVERVDAPLDVVHLNERVREAELHTGTDEQRGSLAADLDAVRERLAGREDLLVESHLAHHLDDLDRVVVLRCQPAELERRLRERGEPPEKARENTGTAEPSRAPARKARENAEAEALDVVLAEAVDRHGRERVHEVETTDRDPDDVAREIGRVLAGDREPSAGEVDYTEYLTEDLQ